MLVISLRTVDKKSFVCFQGGIILINIDWKCNLDPPYGADECLPKYSFRRLDNPDAETADKGFHFM